MSRDEQNRVFREWAQEHAALLTKISRVYAAPGEHRELLQDLLIAIWKAVPLYRGEAAVRTFLYRVALNRIFSRARTERMYRRRHTPLDGDEHASPECHRQSGDEGRIAILYQAIRALPEADRSIAMMYLEEMSYAEIADVLGISVSNVGVRLHRVRARLTQFVRQGAMQ